MIPAMSGHRVVRDHIAVCELAGVELDLHLEGHGDRIVGGKRRRRAELRAAVLMIAEDHEATRITLEDVDETPSLDTEVGGDSAHIGDVEAVGDPTLVVAMLALSPAYQHAVRLQRMGGEIERAQISLIVEPNRDPVRLASGDCPIPETIHRHPLSPSAA